MLDHLDILVADLKRAKSFYSAILEPLGGRLIHEDQFGLTFETGDSHDGYIWIGIGEPRPFHFAFQAKTREAVNEFYETALANGGKDNGAPSERPSSEDYYAAFIIDPEGYRLEAVLHWKGE
jgi:catechol 2,3-dioxygenase-like lactoylglutathione lyase family enzyme